LKKYKKIAYIFLILVIAILVVMLYYNISKGNSSNSKDSKEKSLSEVEFLEGKLVSLFNQMNNVEIQNYNESSSETPQQTEDEINWEYVKGEVETLYSSIPTITLDLYQIGVAQEDILEFNKEFDQLTKKVEEEKKEETLSELAKLYSYIPKFMDKVTNEEIKKIVSETKANLFNAYSKLDSKNWNEIANNIKQTIDTYSALMTSTNVETSKQYTVSRAYVMLNELQNAVNIQDKTIFLIKYKNILEEINNL
jgi:hypothetical protein